MNLHKSSQNLNSEWVDSFCQEKHPLQYKIKLKRTTILWARQSAVGFLHLCLVFTVAQRASCYSDKIDEETGAQHLVHAPLLASRPQSRSRSPFLAASLTIGASS